jgi:hypothetical protein
VPDAAVLTSIASLGMRPIDGAVLPWNYVTVLLNGILTIVIFDA